MQAVNGKLIIQLEWPNDARTAIHVLYTRRMQGIVG